MQRSSTMWAEKEPQPEEPPMVFHASSRSHHFSELDEQLSFSCPTSTSTPSKTTSRPCSQSVSSDSRCSMTPFETGSGGSFSLPGGMGICHSSLTPATSVSGYNTSPAVGGIRPHHCLLSPFKCQTSH